MVQQAILAADALLTQYPLGSKVSSGSAAGQQMVALADLLNQYNTGKIGPGHG